MAMRISATLRKSYFDICGLSEALLRDTVFALSELNPLVLKYREGQASGDDVNFWTTLTIHSFMAQVDGLGYAMRRAVLRSADECGLPLSMKEKAKLSEKKYDAETDSIVEGKQALLSTEPGIKLALNYFPKLYGSSYVLDTSGVEWRGFQRVVKVRNRLTHPKFPEHLLPHNASLALHPSVIWFYGEILKLFSDVGSSMGTPIGPVRDLGGAPKFPESESPWRTFFSDEDHRIIRESGSKTLEYVNRMFVMMHVYLGRSLDLCTGLDSLKTFKSQRSQFALRAYLRALFSTIEGYTSVARFQLDAAVARGMSVLTEGEEASLVKGEVEDCFASAMTLWSRELGDGSVAPRSGTAWTAIQVSRAMRNRVTHPKSVEDMEITLKNTRPILHAFDYFTSDMDCLYLDPEKWAIKGGSVMAAIEREQDLESEREAQNNEDSE